MADPLTGIAKQTLAPVGDVIKRIAGPLADEIGESLALLARPYRIALSVKMFKKTQRTLKEAGLPAQPVPPRLFLPMLEAASIENDEDLHTKWSALLANAASSPEKVHPSFIEILKQLTPDDARLLDKLYTATNDQKYRWLNRSLWDADQYGIPFQNLMRLGMIQVTYDVDGMKVSMRSSGDPFVSGEMKEERWLTEFAVAFIEACHPPKTIEGDGTEHGS
jgi:abortive infection alpha-like protein